jgi:CBS domain containing-hemolysin-like protein
VPLSSILRDAYYIPETKRASDLLSDLQQRRVHMAIVVDEYDSEDPFVEFVGDEEYIIDARVDLDDLNRLMNVELPTEDSDTLGGFIYSELGRVPVVGNQVTYKDIEFTVESVAGRRIKKVRVQRRLPIVLEDEVQGEGHQAANGNGDGNGRKRSIRFMSPKP